MGFLISLIAMVAVFGVLLPLMAMLYFDILEVREQTKHQQQVIQRMINEAKDKRDANRPE
jgi:cell division protein FtsB